MVSSWMFHLSSSPQVVGAKNVAKDHFSHAGPRVLAYERNLIMFGIMLRNPEQICDVSGSVNTLAMTHIVNTMLEATKCCIN